MKKFIYLVLSCVAISTIICSCNDYETYADQKKKENAAIDAYLANNNVKVISEDEFEAQGYTTDTTKNEYVLFESSGIYLQIIRKGGKNGQEANEHFQPLKSGETSDILCRFDEYNLLGDSLQLSNNNLYFSSIVEKMTVTNSSGTFSGSFNTSSSIMYSAYSSTSVPSGWLYPLTYINLGRPVDDDEEIAKIKVVVPSKQGQYYASQNVYPCLYVLTYERGK